MTLHHISIARQQNATLLCTGGRSQDAAEACDHILRALGRLQSAGACDEDLLDFAAGGLDMLRKIEGRIWKDLDNDHIDRVHSNTDFSELEAEVERLKAIVEKKK